MRQRKTNGRYMTYPSAKEKEGKNLNSAQLECRHIQFGSKSSNHPLCVIKGQGCSTIVDICIDYLKNRFVWEK